MTVPSAERQRATIAAKKATLAVNAMFLKKKSLAIVAAKSAISPVTVPNLAPAEEAGWVWAPVPVLAPG